MDVVLGSEFHSDDGAPRTANLVLDTTAGTISTSGGWSSAIRLSTDQPSPIFEGGTASLRAGGISAADTHSQGIQARALFSLDATLSGPIAVSGDKSSGVHAIANPGGVKGTALPRAAPAPYPRPNDPALALPLLQDVS